MKKKKCIVIGANGFIGSVITQEASAQGFEVLPVTRSNYSSLKNTHADLLINAAGNSKKYLDARDPVKGFKESVSDVMSFLHDFQFDFFVHLSSGAIYPHEGDLKQTTEAAQLDPLAMSNYGFHKWLSESLVSKYAPKSLILRMGGFVGPGLKKNAIFDLLTDKPLLVNIDSEFQFMDTRDLAKSVFALVSKQTMNHELFNISALGTVSLRQIVAWSERKETDLISDLPIVRAEINLDKVSKILDLPLTETTVKNFIREATLDRRMLG
ncbi:MAG: SDR family oxidoreductase [Lentisphaerae bacterium]|jgi:nucleoside-diphosphate-sugar epimerase|nr:SDR family oxidoreductase [Lentisphaerota bacterium]